MNVFMTAEIRINVRTTAEIKRELEITARLRGVKVSSLVNLLVVRAIREEKEREPQAFAGQIKNPEMIQIPDKGALSEEQPAEKKKKTA